MSVTTDCTQLMLYRSVVVPVLLYLFFLLHHCLPLGEIDFFIHLIVVCFFFWFLGANARYQLAYFSAFRSDDGRPPTIFSC